MSKVEKLINLCITKHITLSTMESCTGGGLVNCLTNVSGSSDVIKFCCVTYSNDFKIKMGVNSKTIEQYSVYSMEVAKEMSNRIALFTNSNFGIGITGKLNIVDKNNLSGKDNIVYVSIFDKINNKYFNNKIEVMDKTRETNKSLVINKIIDMLLDIIK